MVRADIAVGVGLGERVAVRVVGFCRYRSERIRCRAIQRTVLDEGFRKRRRRGVCPLTREDTVRAGDRLAGLIAVGIVGVDRGAGFDMHDRDDNNACYLWHD